MEASGVETSLHSHRVSENRPADRRQVRNGNGGSSRSCGDVGIQLSLAGFPHPHSSFLACLLRGDDGRSSALLEWLTLLVHCEQISCEFACDRKRGTIAMSALELAGMQRRQLRIPAGSELGCFDQCGLEPRIALFRNGTTLLLVGGRFQSCG